MRKNLLLIVWLVLIMLTICTALVSNSTLVTTVAVTFILVLAAIKFILVANYFMEMKKAHSFWKFSIIFYLIIVMGTLLFILK
ncbi:cytochrome C oxidase subunit IV family protein [Lutibacter maritimus]|jgi:heme/copper-type cytochrome/quinol oxidase subunit 4|uniref:Cytochrome C oxidase subunit IV n=1 Tax=Lutibacter maritimus TaxID=593133 RepID=A0A1I6QHY5_9FLAO|nr:cytochrome C oxidase subunit IV family protein [Lutibacter maritimus]SFS51928.1 Cytochrome C oxidase subunit IV [Lutibacter maritimus]